MLPTRGWQIASCNKWGLSLKADPWCDFIVHLDERHTENLFNVFDQSWPTTNLKRRNDNIPITCLNYTIIPQKMTALTCFHLTKPRPDLTGVMYLWVKNTVITYTVCNGQKWKEDNQQQRYCRDGDGLTHSKDSGVKNRKLCVTLALETK